MRLSVRHWSLIATGLAATAILLLLLMLEYGPTSLSPEQAAREPALGAHPTVPGNPLELSVFEQPRPVPELRIQDDQGHDLTLADFRGPGAPVECSGDVVRAMPPGDADS